MSTPASRRRVLHAYTVKENLRQLLELAGTNPDRSLISHRLWRFYAQAAASDSPEVHRLAATVEARTDGVVHVQGLDVRLHQAVKDAVACGALRALAQATPGCRDA